MQSNPLKFSSNVKFRRGADASHDRNQKDGRDREKEDRKGRKDESRERVGVLGGQGKERDRMDERGRRIGGAGGGPPAQQVCGLPIITLVLWHVCRATRLIDSEPRKVFQFIAMHFYWISLQQRSQQACQNILE